MGWVTWNGPMGWSHGTMCPHGMVKWDGSHATGHMGLSHRMATWDGHMGLSHGMGHMVGSLGMDHMGLSH